MITRLASREERAGREWTVVRFAYPDGEMSDDGRKMLKRLGVRHSLTIGSYPAPKPEDKEVLIHGRVPIYESVSFCKDFFACRLWASGKISELKY